MTQQETKTDLLRRIRVIDEDGDSHIVLEWSDFIRAQSSEGWSNWDRYGGRFKLGQHTISPTVNNLGFVNTLTGKAFTIASSTRPH